MAEHDTDCKHGRPILTDCAACAAEREQARRFGLIHDEHGPAAPANVQVSCRRTQCHFPACSCDCAENYRHECRADDTRSTAEVQADLRKQPGPMEIAAVGLDIQTFPIPDSTLNLPTDAKARKAIPMARGLLDYFPNALAAVAELSRIGNDQHNPGQPMHWAKEKSTDHADCILRHMADRGTIDTDNVRHSTKMAWRALSNLEIEILAERGDPDAIRQVRALGTKAQNTRLDAILKARGQ